MDEVPITPEKVLRALERKGRKGRKGSGESEGSDGMVREGPTSFPDVPWPDPLRVPPPWEGGDGRALNQDTKSEAAAVGPAKAGIGP